MKFRLKIMLCMIWLLSLAFGIGGSVMIWGSFSSALAQEKQTAEDSYRFLVRTIEMVNSINTLPNTSDIAGVLKKMDGMGITNFSAIRSLQTTRYRTFLTAVRAASRPTFLHTAGALLYLPTRPNRCAAGSLRKCASKEKAAHDK